MIKKTVMASPKSVEELRETAVIYWPDEIAEKEKDLSVLPILLSTQESFISVLKLADQPQMHGSKQLN